MTDAEIVLLKKRAAELFTQADRHCVRDSRYNYMEMKRLRAKLARAEPHEPRHFLQMAFAYHRLGRDCEAELYFEKAGALVDVSREKPDRLTPRRRDMKTVAAECLLQKAGTAMVRFNESEGRILGAAARTAGGRWALPVRLDWKALRGAGREYETEMLLDCGKLVIDPKGKVVDDRAAELYRVALTSFTGAFIVRRTRGAFTCIFPHQYGRIMIARLRRLGGGGKGAVQEQGNPLRREIAVSGRRVVVEDYESAFTFHLPQNAFFALLGLTTPMRKAFASLKQPSVVVAFNRVIAVRPCEDPENPDEVLLDPGINRLYHAAFERIRRKVLHGKPFPLEEPYEFDYAGSAPLPPARLLTAKELARERFERPALDGGSGPLQFKAARPEVQAFIESAYRAIMDSVWPTPVKGAFNGKPFEGRVAEAGATHYANYFIHDAFRNTMAMSYFDSALAQELMLTMLRYGMHPNGAFPNGKCNSFRSDDCQWMHQVWTLYDLTRDKAWLAEIYEALEKLDGWWERYAFVKEAGLYTGRYTAPDYDWPVPGEDRNVFSAGLNSTVYMSKMLMARMAEELGKEGGPNRAQAEALRARINDLMWDDRLGFYFNYDGLTRKLFRTSAPDGFLKSSLVYNLHNLAPLACGVPEAGQAKRMMGVLNDPAIFGRFRGVVETVSASGCDERRLRVWPFPNWIILQGLRQYGLHREADRLSTELYNMCFRAWYVQDDFPECFDATHRCLPEENPYVGGVGTISVPLLLVLDRIGIYHSALPDHPGFRTRPVTKSGIGDLSFRCRIAGKSVEAAFREGKGLAITAR